MKKILFSLIAILVCIGLVGGAFAWFSDADTSEENTFTAGVLDLEMRRYSPDQTAWSYEHIAALAYASNMAPGVEVGPWDIRFRNGGTMDGKVRITLSYGNYDVTGYGEYASDLVGPHAYAKKLVVNRSYLDAYSENKAPYWAAQIIGVYGNAAAAVSDGAIVDATPVDYYGDPMPYLPTIYGMSQIEVQFMDHTATPLVEEVWSKDEMHYINLYMKLDENADNAYAFDGVEIFFTGTLSQYIAP
jgi:predicted ribosomally synthesized peptide with SipW-like signal peptide